MSAATHNVKKVAEHRQRILTLLLNNKELVDGILGRPGDEHALSQSERLNQTAEIRLAMRDGAAWLDGERLPEQGHAAD